MRNFVAAIVAAIIILIAIPQQAQAVDNNVVAKAKSTINGTTYQTICTRLAPGDSDYKDGQQPSSVSVKSSTTFSNGVANAKITVKTGGQSYIVIGDPVAGPPVTTAVLIAELDEDNTAPDLVNVRCVSTIS